MMKEKKVCPECGYEFKGNDFVGIDGHWRAKRNHQTHEGRMPYEKAWPLIKSGVYKRPES